MREPKLNAFMSIIRGCQDIIGTFVLGGVFERHPRLRGTLTRMPSEYFREHVDTTFQDDWVALQVKDLCNIRRLMWANDLPHRDSTWPTSQEVLRKHTAHLTQEERDLVLHDNAAELYQLAARTEPTRAPRRRRP